LIFGERGGEKVAEVSRKTEQIRFGKWNQPWWEKQLLNLSEFYFLFHCNKSMLTLT